MWHCFSSIFYTKHLSQFEKTLDCFSPTFYTKYLSQFEQMRDSACHPSCIPAYQAFVPVWANVRPFLYPPCTPGICPTFSKHKILFLTHIVSWAPVPVWVNTRLFSSTLHTKHLSQFQQTLDCSHQLVYHYQAYVPVCANTKPFYVYVLCASGSVNMQCFVWTFSYAKYKFLCTYSDPFYIPLPSICPSLSKH